VNFGFLLGEKTRGKNKQQKNQKFLYVHKKEKPKKLVVVEVTQPQFFSVVVVVVASRG